MSLIRAFFRNRFLSIGSLLALISNVGLWVYLARQLVPQQESIPLHYNIYYGIDLVGPWWYLFFLPAAGSAVVLANTAFSVILQKSKGVSPYFLTTANLVIQLLFFFGSYLAATQV